MAAGLDTASRDIVRRYYLAMAVPFAIDVVTGFVYASFSTRTVTLLPMVMTSPLFLLGGMGIGAWILIRPVQRYLMGELPFRSVERGLARLPRRSALLVAALYPPMMALRLLLEHLGIHTHPGDGIVWIDTVVSFVVLTSFNAVLAYFIVSAYFDHLCDHLFQSRAVNISTFHGSFRRKVGLAVLFVSFSIMTLLAGDIASYQGERLIREATVDVTVSAIATVITYYWISRALTGPIARLDRGMQQVAAGKLEVRLPVTSDDEVGHATSGFNHMAEGLAERQYLRDTFGKYMSESVAAAILGDRERRGRVADTLAEATLMFTDIEGFTGLSESLAPADVATILNKYYGAVVPVIQQHGGVVNNCIGDGLFASFNLPLPQQNHAAAALRAALDIQKAIGGMSFPAGAAVRTRIGINTGAVIGVTIGTADWLSYTLLGDAVNIASRVEQLNKQFGSLILATESTVKAAGEGFVCHRLGGIDVRGHRGDVVLYRIDPPA